MPTCLPEGDGYQGATVVIEPLNRKLKPICMWLSIGGFSLAIVIQNCTVQRGQLWTSLRASRARTIAWGSRLVS